MVYMKYIGSDNPLHEGVTVGSSKINCLLNSGNMVNSGNKLKKKQDIMSLQNLKSVFAARKWQYRSEGREVPVAHPEKLLFTTERMQNIKISTSIGKANAIVGELHHSVVRKRELSNISNLTFFKFFFALILIWS